MQMDGMGLADDHRSARRFSVLPHSLFHCKGSSFLSYHVFHQIRHWSVVISSSLPTLMSSDEIKDGTPTVDLVLD
jgi:hypothetical protein